MKILLDIREKFKEVEIHICSDRRTKEVTDIYDELSGIFSAKITAYEGQRIETLATYEIVRIYSENKKVYVRTKDGTYEVKERLYALEDSLSDKGFVRISNSEMVGISKIDKLDMSYAGTIKMYMTNGDETYVSRRYVAKIKQLLVREVKK